MGGDSDIANPSTPSTPPPLGCIPAEVEFMSDDSHQYFETLRPALERLGAKLRVINADHAVAVLFAPNGITPRFKIGAGLSDVAGHAVVYCVHGDWKPGRCQIVKYEDARDVVAAFVQDYHFRHPDIPDGR